MEIKNDSKVKIADGKDEDIDNGHSIEQADFKDSVSKSTC